MSSQPDDAPFNPDKAGGFDPARYRLLYDGERIWYAGTVPSPEAINEHWRHNHGYRCLWEYRQGANSDVAMEDVGALTSLALVERFVMAGLVRQDVKRLGGEEELLLSLCGRGQIEPHAPASAAAWVLASEPLLVEELRRRQKQNPVSTAAAATRLSMAHPPINAAQERVVNEAIATLEPLLTSSAERARLAAVGENDPAGHALGQLPRTLISDIKLSATLEGGIELVARGLDGDARLKYAPASVKMDLLNELETREVRRASETAPTEGTPETAPLHSTSDESAERFTELLASLQNGLSPKLRDFLNEFVGQAGDIAAAARALGISRNTADQRLSRIRDKATRRNKKP